MDKKGTNIFCWNLGMIERNKRPEAYFFISSIRNIIGQEGTFMDKKGTTLLLGIIEKEQNLK